jgi:hypothetical protein
LGGIETIGLVSASIEAKGLLAAGRFASGANGEEKIPAVGYSFATTMDVLIVKAIGSLHLSPDRICRVAEESGKKSEGGLCPVSRK